MPSNTMNNVKRFGVFKSKFILSFPKTIKDGISSINNSKFVLGIAMLLINIGSRYIELGFTKTQEQALRNGLGRELLIFSIIFMATHDIIVSTMMTASFIVLSDYLFNENSRLCVLPERLKLISKMIDENKDDIISPEEEKKAIEILRKAKKQTNKIKKETHELDYPYDNDFPYLNTN